MKRIGYRIPRRKVVQYLGIGGLGLAGTTCAPASAPTAAPPPTAPPKAQPTSAPQAPSPAPAAKATEAPKAPSPAATKPQPNRPKEMMTLRLGMPVKNFLSLAVYLADKNGYLKEENLSVDLQHFEASATIMKGMLSGSLDMTKSDTAGPIAAISEGADLKLVGTWANLIHYLLATKKEIKSLRDLYGKSVAISQPGSLPDVVIRKLFDVEKLDIKQVDLVGVGSSGARATALVSGKVDASTFQVEEVDLVEKSPDLHVLFFVSEKLPQYVRGALTVQNRLAKDKPEALEGFMRAVLRGVRFTFDKPDETKTLAMEYLGLSRAQVDKIYAYYAGLPLWDPNGLMDPKNLEFMQDVNVDIGMQKTKMPLTKFADQTPTERALATLGRYEIKNKPAVPKVG